MTTRKRKTFSPSLKLEVVRMVKERGQTSGLLDYANTALGLPRVLALVRAENQRSMHLLDKLGLRFDRVITHPDGDRELRVYAVDMANRR